MYRGVDAVGYYRVDHVLDPRRKGKGQYFWRKAVVRHFYYYYYYYYYFSICRHNITTARKIRDVVGTIYEAVLHLPKPIRRVCIVSLHLLLSKKKKDWLNLKKMASRGFKRYKLPLSWDGSRTFSTLPPTSPKSWPKKYITNLISTELLELVVWHF